MYRGYFHIFRHFSTRLWGTVPPSKQLEFLNLHLNYTSNASISNTFIVSSLFVTIELSLQPIQELNIIPIIYSFKIKHKKLKNFITILPTTLRKLR